MFLIFRIKRSEIQEKYGMKFGKIVELMKGGGGILTLRNLYKKIKCSKKKMHNIKSKNIMIIFISKYPNM